MLYPANLTVNHTNAHIFPGCVIVRKYYDQFDRHLVLHVLAVVSAGQWVIESSEGWPDERSNVTNLTQFFICSVQDGFAYSSYNELITIRPGMVLAIDDMVLPQYSILNEKDYDDEIIEPDDVDNVWHRIAFWNALTYQQFIAFPIQSKDSYYSRVGEVIDNYDCLSHQMSSGSSDMLNHFKVFGSSLEQIKDRLFDIEGADHVRPGY